MKRAMAAGAVLLAALLALTACAPTPAVAPPGPSRAEIKATLSYLAVGTDDGYAKYGIDLLRPIETRSAGVVYRACLAEIGVPGVTWALGTFRTDYTGAAAAVAQQDAITICRLEFPKADDVRQLRTVRQWGYQYDYLRNVFTPCVRAEGLSVPALGTRSAFIAAARNFAVADAYQTMNIDVTSVRGRALAGRCPSLALGLEG
jgi:hypothetical protein